MSRLKDGKREGRGGENLSLAVLFKYDILQSEIRLFTLGAIKGRNPRNRVSCIESLRINEHVFHPQKFVAELHTLVVK